MDEKIALADEKAFLWINGLAGNNGVVDQIMVWIASDYLIPVSMTLVLVGMWFVGRDLRTRTYYQIGMVAALTSMALSNLVVLISNSLYARERPFLQLDVTQLLYTPTEFSSFPSNAAAATCGIAFACLMINRKLGWCMLTAAIVYGFSRVYTGVHFPGDVLAGTAIGLFVSLVVFHILKPLVEPLLIRILKVARMLCIA